MYFLYSEDGFYKPYVVEDLVKYIKDIYAYMPTRPLFYYHIPFFTNVNGEFRLRPVPKAALEFSYGINDFAYFFFHS